MLIVFSANFEHISHAFLVFLLTNLVTYLFPGLNKKPIPANIYLFKVNNKNTRKRCEICSKLTIKTPERCFYC